MNVHVYDFANFVRRSQNKLDEFNLLMEKLPKPKIDGPWIAGGAIRNLLCGDSVTKSDIDYFFRDVNQFSDFCTEMDRLGAIKKYENKFNTTWFLGEQKVQAISVAYYNDTISLLDSFDFTICQIATDGINLIVGEFALWDIGRKKLAVNRVTYGTSTVRRMLKYAKSGFTACSGCISDILESCSRNPETILREVEYID